MAHDGLSGAFVDFRGIPNLQTLPVLTGLQDDGQHDPGSRPSSDGACRRRLYEQGCPYHKGDVAPESPMFRYVEYFPNSHISHQPYIGDSYGNQVFICADEDRACSSQCDCQGLGPRNFAFIATKAPALLSIAFNDSALGQVVAAVLISGGTPASNPSTGAWAATSFDGLAVLAQHARLKQLLELLDPSLPVVPTLRLLVDGFLADGQVFKSFGYNNLFERGQLSLELWKEFQRRQLDDDITLLDDSFNAVAEERAVGSFEEAHVDNIPAAEAVPLHEPDTIAIFETQGQEILDGPVIGAEFEEAGPRWTSEEGVESICSMSLRDSGAVVYYGRFSKSDLVAAAAGGNESMVQSLLNRGVGINHRQALESALEAAAEGGHVSVVQLLLDSGADVNYHGVFAGFALAAAAERGYESVVRLLLDRGADANNGWYSTPLEAAAERGDESMVRLLLDGGADINYHEWASGCALVAATAQGHKSVVRLLLERGANANCGRCSKPPLTATAERGDEPMVRLLLDGGADVNYHEWASGCALVAATERGHEAVVRLLLERGANANCGRCSKSALEAAVGGGHESVVRLLLDRGVNVDPKWLSNSALEGAAEGCLDKSPLEKAMEGGHESIVRLLLDRGAIQRDTFLSAALKGGCNETAYRLYKLGWRSPRDRALVVRMLREARNQKEAAKRRSHPYMAICYDTFVQECGRVADVASLKRDGLVEMALQLKGPLRDPPGWEFNERIRGRFVKCRAAWQSGIRTLRRVSGGQLPDDPGEVLAFLCVCRALSKTLDFFTGSEYATLFLGDLRRWGLLFEDSFDCYSQFIRGLWGVDITNEPLLSPSGDDLLRYAQGLVSSLVGAASGLVRPMADGEGDELEKSQQRWLERHATRLDVDNDILAPVSPKPPDEPVPDTPRLSDQILHHVSSAQTSGRLVILMTGAIFAIILIFLLWLRTTSIQGIPGARICPSLRLPFLPIGGGSPLVKSCMVLETYLSLRSKAHEFEPFGAPWDLNISPPPGEARDNANGLADGKTSVPRQSTSVFSARTGELGRRNNRFCNDCRRLFASRSNYLRHRREKHDLKKAVCPVCRKTLSRQDYLATHLAENKCRKR